MSNSAFLCGNGFSMNFDSGFSDIHSRLYRTHQKLYQSTRYSVFSNPTFKQKLMENYKAVLNRLRRVTEEEFYRIFDDGIAFAASIVEHPHLEYAFREKKYVNNLTFKMSEWTSLVSLYEVGINRGAEYVNLEYWPILIHFYYALLHLGDKEYVFPVDNLFIELIRVGNSSLAQLETGDGLQHYTMHSGLNTYYRMLFSLAIYNDGKALVRNDLDRTSNLNMQRVTTYLNTFNTLFTLNYDHILEHLTNRPVYHLHGTYSMNGSEYFYNQNFLIRDTAGSVSCSSILIGDFFVNKSMLLTVANLSASHDRHNVKPIMPSDIIARKVKEQHISHFTIFGMNVFNDQDIIRYILIAFFQAQIEMPHITYCYFSDAEKIEFEQQYRACVTFSKELNHYVDKIKVDFARTQDVLHEHFNK